jgi:hypothetical protein
MKDVAVYGTGLRQTSFVTVYVITKKVSWRRLWSQKPTPLTTDRHQWRKSKMTNIILSLGHDKPFAQSRHEQLFLVETFRQQ